MLFISYCDFSIKPFTWGSINNEAKLNKNRFYENKNKGLQSLLIVHPELKKSELLSKI